MNNHTVVHQSGLGRVTNHSYWILTTVYDRADQFAAFEESTCGPRSPEQFQ